MSRVGPAPATFQEKIFRLMPIPAPTRSRATYHVTGMSTDVLPQPWSYGDENFIVIKKVTFSAFNCVLRPLMDALCAPLVYSPSVPADSLCKVPLRASTDHGKDDYASLVL